MRPVSLKLETKEAYSFLRQFAPLLEQNGFGVLLPTWWEKPSVRLGVKLKLKSPGPVSTAVGKSLFGLDALGTMIGSCLWEMSRHIGRIRRACPPKDPIGSVEG